MEKSCDLLIIGGGIAGLNAALEASKFCQVIVLTKGKIGETATEKAQGGIAAAIDQYQEAGGTQFALTLEGAHKRRRILHAGDETGAEIEKTLGRRVVAEKKVQIDQQVMGFDLLIRNGRCFGATAYDQKSGEIVTYNAKVVLLATGGVCQVYLYTTNPAFAVGDGVAMAYRAGAAVTDMEFIQFHPTALVQFKQFEDIVALPQFLISEAVRGEGGVLLNNRGERFMEKYHTHMELAPRDIVARAIFNEMKETNDDHVFLSLKEINPDKIKHRFPMIYRTCLERCLDITKDNIPVAPAAHYFMGGIKTDLKAMTNIPGLLAAGECASTGVHGANRLASNSLLEGLVFGYRAALTADREIRNFKPEADPKTPNINYAKPRLSQIEISRLKLVIKTAMWHGVGIIRSASSLQEAQHKLARVEKQLPDKTIAPEELELKNMLLVAQLTTRGALDRQESRGGHFRADFPARDDQHWKKHLVYQLMDKA